MCDVLIYKTNNNITFLPFKKRLYMSSLIAKQAKKCVLILIKLYYSHYLYATVTLRVQQ